MNMFLETLYHYLWMTAAILVLGLMILSTVMMVRTGQLYWYGAAVVSTSAGWCIGKWRSDEGEDLEEKDGNEE